MNLFANPVGYLLTCGAKLCFSLVVFQAKALQNHVFNGSWLNQTQAWFSLRKLKFPNNSNDYFEEE
ncbi:MAG: hypothetical protein LBC53_03425 [Spirochaetaceae bacterium]|jgi:hypothetical protein|nr:hypothetical protein [Spirochaetaceae bacterium]